jgi:hypothetical protein
MRSLKLLVPASIGLLAAYLLLENVCCEAPPKFYQRAIAPIYLQRSHLVQEHYQLYSKRLETYYASLSGALKAMAPDLLSMLESPRPPRHGYGILPKITTGAVPPEGRLRGRSAWYSWPWTDTLIDTELDEISRCEAKLRHAGELNLVARRGVYESLARDYGEIRERQQNIDAHIQYNRLWQAAIASDRAGYDRESVLYDKVIERHAIGHALIALNDGALREREKLLARDIHEALDRVATPSFVRVEHRSRRLWTVRVPFYTDIDDHDFVQSVKASIENIWRFRDGENEFRVELAISYIPVMQLYTARQWPAKGDNIAVEEHLALFPQHAAILTTGAVTTHVYGNAIVLGPHDIAPRVLAHEFGHILGFRDTYVRGYKDLGENGFQVMEIVADPADIMGAPDTGRVWRSHFSRILEQFGKPRSANFKLL